MLRLLCSLKEGNLTPIRLGLAAGAGIGQQSFGFIHILVQVQFVNIKTKRRDS